MVDIDPKNKLKQSNLAQIWAKTFTALHSLKRPSKPLHLPEKNTQESILYLTNPCDWVWTTGCLHHSRRSMAWEGGSLKFKVLLSKIFSREWRRNNMRLAAAHLKKRRNIIVNKINVFYSGSLWLAKRTGSTSPQSACPLHHRFKQAECKCYLFCSCQVPLFPNF